MCNSITKMTGVKLKLVIADDHDIYRDGLKSLLQGIDRFELCADSADGEQLLRAIQFYEPDVVITDFKMPGTPMLDVVKYIRQQHPTVGILMLTIMDHEYQIVQALEAGVNGYIIKDAPKSDLLDAIDSVSRKLPYYCRFSTARLVRFISNSYYNPYDKDTKLLFSDIEKNIIQLMCEDKSVKEMASVLFMAERTVEKYRSAVFEKMHVKTVAGVAIYAVKHKLYVIPE
jgi:DNA-binding NarL/FixJ family response regulator